MAVDKKRLELMTIDELINRLDYILVNEKQKNGEIEDKDLTKRDGEIEFIQRMIVRKYAQSMAMKYGSDAIFDWEAFDDSKCKKNQWIIDRTGMVVSSEKRNKLYDSKSFDGILPVSIHGIKYTIYFIMKGVENAGGHQDDVLGEIGTTATNIIKCKNNNYFFIFLLDGTYITRETSKFMDKHSKYTLATSRTVGSEIENFIKQKYGN